MWKICFREKDIRRGGSQGPRKGKGNPPVAGTGRYEPLRSLQADQFGSKTTINDLAQAVTNAPDRSLTVMDGATGIACEQAPTADRWTFACFVPWW